VTVSATAAGVGTTPASVEVIFDFELTLEPSNMFLPEPTKYDGLNTEAILVAKANGVTISVPDGDLQFDADDESIASVDSNGSVSGRGSAGNISSITANYHGKTASSTVEILPLNYSSGYGFSDSAGGTGEFVPQASNNYTAELHCGEIVDAIGGVGNLSAPVKYVTSTNLISSVNVEWGVYQSSKRALTMITFNYSDGRSPVVCGMGNVDVSGVTRDTYTVPSGEVFNGFYVKSDVTSGFASYVEFNSYEKR
ncbi:hypothetical protein, partial [Enterobacter kobei]|uniref:hypothetical protein n=1 Tax=Enterobacter kobei TaxID=208224 RepID=UPI0019D2BAC3